jgi:hypothetical protein
MKIRQEHLNCRAMARKTKTCVGKTLAGKSFLKIIDFMKKFS